MLLALKIVVDSQILDLLLLAIFAAFNGVSSSQKEILAIMALIVARCFVDPEAFSWMLVLYSIYYVKGSLAIVIVLVKCEWMHGIQNRL